MTTTIARLAQLEAMRNSAAFLAWLGGAVDARVHFGQPPEDTPFPRIGVDSPSTDDLSFAGEPGREGVDIYHLWIEGRDESRAVEGAELLHTILDDVALPLPGTGREMVKGNCRLLTTLQDPNIAACQAVMEYRYWIITPLSN